jgi:hypothetical protein
MYDEAKTEMQSAGLSVKVQEPQVSRSVSDLEKAVCCLEEIVDRLCGSLASVVTEPAPIQDPNKKDPGALVPLAAWIRDQTNRIQRKVSILSDIDDRLEI